MNLKYLVGLAAIGVGLVGCSDAVEPVSHRSVAITKSFEEKPRNQICQYLDNIAVDDEYNQGEIIALAYLVSSETGIEVGESLGTYIGITVLTNCREHLDPLSTALDSF